jgi:DNA repair exonuclease SbcCD ATPase subunit
VSKKAKTTTTPAAPTRAELEQFISDTRQQITDAESRCQQLRTEIQREQLHLDGLTGIEQEYTRNEQHARDRLASAQQNHHDAVSEYMRVSRFGTATVAVAESQLKESETDLLRIQRETEQQLTSITEGRNRKATEQQDALQRLEALNAQFVEMSGILGPLGAKYRTLMADLGDSILADHAPMVDASAKELHEAREAEQQAKQRHASAQHQYDQARAAAQDALRDWPHLVARLSQ